MEITTALAIGLSCMPEFVPTHEIVNGEATSKVKYELTNGVLRVYGKGEMPKGMIFRGNNEIKKVIIDEGITSVRKNAFRDRANLETVSLSNTSVYKGSFEKRKVMYVSTKTSIKKNVYPS